MRLVARLTAVQAADIVSPGKAVLWALAFRANEADEVWIDRGDLAHEAGLTSATLGRALAELREAGWLTSRRRPNKPCQFILHLKGPRNDQGEHSGIRNDQGGQTGAVRNDQGEHSGMTRVSTWNDQGEHSGMTRVIIPNRSDSGSDSDPTQDPEHRGNACVQAHAAPPSPAPPDPTPTGHPQVTEPPAAGDLQVTATRRETGHTNGHAHPTLLARRSLADLGLPLSAVHAVERGILACLGAAEPTDPAGVTVADLARIERAQLARQPLVGAKRLAVLDAALDAAALTWRAPSVVERPPDPSEARAKLVGDAWKGAYKAHRNGASYPWDWPKRDRAICLRVADAARVPAQVDEAQRQAHGPRLQRAARAYIEAAERGEAWPVGPPTVHGWSQRIAEWLQAADGHEARRQPESVLEGFLRLTDPNRQPYTETA